MQPTQQARHSSGLTLIIGLLSMFGPFSIDTVFPAFHHIGVQFGASDAAMQQVTSVYLLSFGLMSLVHGPVSDAIGRKPVMLAGIAAYVLASAGCALSANLPMLLVCRALQGMSAGAGQILSRALIRDLYDGAPAQRLMAQVSLIFALAPAIAPILGGWILGVASWPFIFWFLAAFGVVMEALVLVGVPETHPESARTPLAMGSVIGGMLAVGRNLAFMRLALAGGLGFSAQFLYISSAPVFVVRLLGKGDQDFWLLFVPIITAMMIAFWFNARLAARVRPMRLATVGLAISLAGAVLNVLLMLVPGVPALPWSVIGPGIVAGGIALSFPVLQLSMLDMFPTRRGSAASLQAFVSLMLNTVVSGVVSPMVSGTLLRLALMALAFSVGAAALWVWHLAVKAQTPPGSDPAPTTR